MKLAAHRGASVEKTENTVEAILLAKEIGAYAAECDLRKTSDGEIVLFHDDNMKRLGESDKKVNDITFREMREILAEKGIPLNTFRELCNEYKGGDMYILCDIGNDNWQGGFYWECDDNFFAMLKNAPFKVICGVHKPEEAKIASKYFPSEQILAFMPSTSLAEEFYKNGAGILRLWEHWLSEITPSDIKKKCPNAEVWIMASTKEFGHNGCESSFKLASELFADGMILNDIRQAIEYFK